MTETPATAASFAIVELMGRRKFGAARGGITAEHVLLPHVEPLEEEIADVQKSAKDGLRATARAAISKRGRR
jgi:hypothetical protein